MDNTVYSGVDAEWILLNIGNTTTQIAARLPDGRIEIINESATETLDLTPWWNCKLAAASVVPFWTKQLADGGAFLVNSAHSGGLDLSCMDSSTLGADRLANSICADREFPGKAVVVCDFGTAIDIEVLDGGHRMLGGAIMPGRKLLRQSLNRGTAQLPELPLSNTVPEKIGYNTVSALALGIDAGVIGSVREVLKRIQHALGTPAVYVGIGGDAEYFLPHFAKMKYGGKDFTLRGVALSLEYELKNAR